MSRSTTQPAAPPAGARPRLEERVQLVLTLAVGAVAACAAWSHVLELARVHGQPGWLAWSVAACIETSAVSAGLEVRRRRQAATSAVFPVLVLVAATALQLAAQVAQAQRSTWGVVLAAVPAVTFLVLVKLAISRPAASHPAMPAARPSEVQETALPAPAPSTTPESASRPARVPAVRSSSTDTEVLAAARAVAEQLVGEGMSVTRAALAAGLRARGVPVGTARAGQLAAQLRAESHAGRSVAGDLAVREIESGARGRLAAVGE